MHLISGLFVRWFIKCRHERQWYLLSSNSRNNLLVSQDLLRTRYRWRWLDGKRFVQINTYVHVRTYVDAIERVSKSIFQNRGLDYQFKLYTKVKSERLFIYSDWPYFSVKCILYKILFLHRSFKEETISESQEKISVAIGLITKMVSMTLLESSGLATRTYTC